VALAAKAAGIIIAVPCGGRGICGGCAVKVVKGALEPPGECEYVTLRRAPEGIRLACQARVSEAVTVAVSQYERTLLADTLKSSGFDGVPIIAIDCGSTTISALVSDSDTGLEKSRVSVANGQARLGADIISRVDAALRGHAADLQLAIVKSLSHALELACVSAGVKVANVNRALVVGNPVMIATLLGADLSGFASAPYTIPEQVKNPTDTGPLAHLLGFRGEIAILPSVASFVGGDLVAGLFASGIGRHTLNTLYVDIGTNVELALVHDGRITATSVPAGPAFEGYGISYGGVFGKGAVTGAYLQDRDIVLKVEGDVIPNRLCGSGLVSIIALLRKTGHLDSSGRMWPQGPLAHRFKEIGEEIGFILGAEGSDLHVLQSDVRFFQVAKAAVSAGIKSLMARAGVSVCNTIVSGAFGGVVTKQQMLNLGIVPLDTGEVRIFKDAALSGAAALSLLSEGINAAQKLYEMIEHEELATSEVFRRNFVDATVLESEKGKHTA